MMRRSGAYFFFLVDISLVSKRDWSSHLKWRSVATLAAGPVSASWEVGRGKDPVSSTGAVV